MKHTNKEKLFKGLRYLGFALPLSFIGPIIVYSAFHNQNQPLYIPILILGIIALISAIAFMFRGIFTVVSAVFD